VTPKPPAEPLRRDNVLLPLAFNNGGIEHRFRLSCS
jgi:hypothetical protein